MNLLGSYRKPLACEVFVVVGLEAVPVQDDMHCEHTQDEELLFRELLFFFAQRLGQYASTEGRGARHGGIYVFTFLEWHSLGEWDPQRSPAFSHFTTPLFPELLTQSE